MKKDFTVIKFSRECRKFFINHVNCLNSGKNTKSKFHFICALTVELVTSRMNSTEAIQTIGKEQVKFYFANISFKFEQIEGRK